jgi:hypothetical protein
MRTDGRTDVTKLIVAFRNYAHATKNASLKRITFKLSYFFYCYSDGLDGFYHVLGHSRSCFRSQLVWQYER